MIFGIEKNLNKVLNKNNLNKPKTLAKDVEPDFNTPEFIKDAAIQAVMMVFLLLN